MASPKGELALPVHENLLMKEKSHSQNSDDTSDMESEDGRKKWAKKTEYILSVIGYCVGMGNIWRFPYVCMRSGGGAFLIPFFLSLFICAFPVYFLEVALGQFLGKSAWHAWQICPLFRGIGLSMNILCFLLGWYYSMILAWCLIYLGNSFKSPLPWTQCGQWWNTDNCIAPKGFNNSTDSTSSETNTTMALGNNITSLLGNTTSGQTEERTAVSSSVEFWQHNVLELSPSIEEMGGLPWHTVVALISANFVVLVAVIKGIHSSGKVVYVTATLPYILLAVILIMGCTLPGSGDGLLFYIKPDFSKLLLFQTWVEASIQVFYSLGPAWGGLVTMASYNKFNNNCLKDSIMLTLICEGTSIFGGFAIFSILGHMAYIAQVPILDFAKSGPGLAFIVYPEAISYLPVPQLWGFLFFIMLFTLGLDSQFASIETLLTTFADVWPVFMRRWRVVFTIGAMVFFTLVGLVFAARGGAYMFQLVDWYIAAFSLFTQAALECVIIAWIYGADNFCRDIEMMIGRRPPHAIVLAWKYISPVLLMVLFVITLFYYKPPAFAGYSYPTYVQGLGWCIAVLPFLSVVLYAVYILMTAKGTFIQRVKSSCRPPADWGPSHPAAREKYHYEAVDLSDLDCGLPCRTV